MFKILFSVVLAAVVSSALFCATADGQTLQRADYASMTVPDVSQALSFFRRVLDCELIDDAATSTHSALVICEDGMVVELVKSPATGIPVKSAALRFAVSDVAHADRWLKRDGVQVVGRTVVPGSGRDSGEILVNFVAPWGQPLQLVGPADPQISSAP